MLANTHEVRLLPLRVRLYRTSDIFGCAQGDPRGLVPQQSQVIHRRRSTLERAGLEAEAGRVPRAPRRPGLRVTRPKGTDPVVVVDALLAARLVSISDL